MLNAAAGRNAYGIAIPAFSDTRPTYSRDAQDEESAPHSDISGGAQTPHPTYVQPACPKQILRPILPASSHCAWFQQRC